MRPRVIPAEILLQMECQTIRIGASMRPRVIPAEIAEQDHPDNVAEKASMRPRVIPAEIGMRFEEVHKLLLLQ